MPVPRLPLTERDAHWRVLITECERAEHALRIACIPARFVGCETEAHELALEEIGVGAIEVRGKQFPPRGPRSNHIKIDVTTDERKSIEHLARIWGCTVVEAMKKACWKELARELAK